MKKIPSFPIFGIFVIMVCIKALIESIKSHNTTWIIIEILLIIINIFVAINNSKNRDKQ